MGIPRPRLRPSRWKRLVAIGASRYRQHQLSSLVIEKWHGDIVEELCAWGLCDPPQLEVQHDSEEFCIPCRQPFRNRRGWFLHAHLKHQYTSPSGRACRGTTCARCAKVYPSAAALKNHLRYSPQCCTYSLLHQDAPIDEDVSTWHPQRPWQYTNKEKISSDGNVDFETLALREELDRHLLIPVDEFVQASWVDKCKEVLSCVLPFPKIANIFHFWVNEHIACGSHAHLVSAADEAVLWLRGLTAAARDSVRQRMEDEQHRLRLRIRAARPQPWDVMPIELYFLHLFSGRRRSNDLQEALERCVLPDHHVLRVLSIDVQVDEKLCNLMDPSARTLWLDLARQQKITGSTAGPPCESWSIARGAPDPNAAEDEKMPRPLRAREEPWGLLAISAREHSQVSTGNSLLTLSLWMALLQALTDSFSATEHPQDPMSYGSRKKGPSIWALSIMQWLRDTGLMAFINVQQGHYGAKSRKPTTLMVSGVSSTILHKLEEDLRCCPLPEQVSIGKCTVGGKTSWQTTSLKEYPPGFCSLIAAYYQAWIDARSSLPSWNNCGAFPWMDSLCRELADCPTSDTIGPDFFRRNA